MIKKFLIGVGLWWFTITSLISYRSLSYATDDSIGIWVGLMLYSISSLVFVGVGIYYCIRGDE